MTIKNRIQAPAKVQAIREERGRMVLLVVPGCTLYLTPAQAIKVAAALVKEADILLRRKK